jgi:hypothetical protein
VQPSERLIAALRRYGETLPDLRQGKNTTYAMADFVLAAFAPFFMQCPCFLAHQRHLETGHGRSNCQSLFSMRKIPCDSQVRAMLDPVDPAHFSPMVADILAMTEESGCLDGRLLIALDGTEYHCSDKIHCPNCSHRVRGNSKAKPGKAGKGKTDNGGNSKIEYFHSMLCASVVAPGHNRAVPLEPEFIMPQDGHDKQDCESRAVRRWLAAHGAPYQKLNPVYLGDDLMSRQPICQAVLDQGGHFIFVCKPDSHPAIEEFRAGIVLDELVQEVRGKQRTRHRYQWLCGVPMRGDDKAINVNWFTIEITNQDGKLTYRNSFITDLPVIRDNVAAMAAAGRARWKIENETFNVLKTKGYCLEHNFGHGQHNLSAVLAGLNLLAFACHTALDLADRSWKAARRTLVTRQDFFNAVRTLTTYLIFSSWEEFLETVAFNRRPPALGP